MRKTGAVLLAVLGLFAGRVDAQVTATAKATWVQPPPNTLAEAQQFKYFLQDAAPTPPTVIPMTATCATVATAVQCSAPVPMPSAGPHKFSVVVTSPDGSLANVSAVLLGVMPGAPNGFTLSVTGVLTVTLAFGGPVP